MDENNKKEFKLKQKVRGHCHYTGKYKGAAQFTYMQFTL